MYQISHGSYHLPVLSWFFDEDRRTYVRRPDPEQSKAFKEAVAKRPQAWAALIKERDLVIAIRPHVLAQLAAGALIQDRGINSSDNSVEVSYRLSNIKTQADPKVDEFLIKNTSKFEETEVQLKGGHCLYNRQKQGLTKLLNIESGKTTYEELEMSESELPGVGWTLNARAVRSSPLTGGVCADAIGAGKTVVSIALILKGLIKSRGIKKDVTESRATLVVVPPGLIEQWADEFDKFTPDELNLKVLVIYNLETLKNLSVGEIIGADVVIAPVDILEGEGKSSSKRSLYLKELFSFTAKKAKKLGIFEKNQHYDIAVAPAVPRMWGARETLGLAGVWFPASSADPYGGAVQSQKKRDGCGLFTDRYREIVSLLRDCKESVGYSDKGVPLEFFRWERIVVDEIHESLCTTKGEMDDKSFSERNRGIAREFLGVAQHDVQKRPLRARGCVFGLTGTPLLDSESRVIELANLMGGAYITSQRSHWRKNERESGRDTFLDLWLEPSRSRMYRRERHGKAEEWMDKAVQRNKAGDLRDLGVMREDIQHHIEMSQGCGKLFLQSTGNGVNSFSVMPPDFDENAGQDPIGMLQCNATLESRKKALVALVGDILSKEKQTNIVVFADAAYGAYKSACDALGDTTATYCTEEDDNLSWNKKISRYRNATVQDGERQRVLILNFENCAGLNLQAACHDVIFYVPVYSMENNNVKDASSEQQAIGRVYRTGQTRDVTIHRIIMEPPATEDEKVKKNGTLDRWVHNRNTNEEAVQRATNASDD